MSGKKVLLIMALLIVSAAAVYASRGDAPLSVDTWCYDCLTDFEKLAYEAVRECLTHLVPSWNCGSIPQETIQKAYDCFLMDHPEVFWSDGYTYVRSYVDNSISGRRVEFKYTMDRAGILRANEEIYDSLLDIVGWIGRTDASMDTVRAVYDYMLGCCTYDELNLDQSMYSVMVNHSGVCASFAKAFEFVMQCLGIPCTVVLGRLSQGSGIPEAVPGHEWNLVMVDGTWYHVDITSALSLTKDTGVNDYSYFCISTEEIRRTHIIDNPVPLPQSPSD